MNVLINRTLLQLECPQKLEGTRTGLWLRSPTLVPPQQPSPISILNLGLKTETLAILKSTCVLPKARGHHQSKNPYIYFLE